MSTTINPPLNRKLRMALIGGGQGSFIGRPHSVAACMFHRAELIAGALSSDPVRARESAPSYGIADDRAYGSYRELFECERDRPDGDRVDFVSITTPNNTHFPIAMAALKAGFHVICDKPMTFTLEEATALCAEVVERRQVFGLTHNYTGYPLARQVREMILGGEAGKVLAVRVRYLQGWLADPLERQEGDEGGAKQARWRTSREQSGKAGAFGDIASHGINLARFMTGELPLSVFAQLRTFVPGRELDDYGTAIIKTQNGGLWTVTASQVSHGLENGLVIEIDCEQASFAWRQENPNELWVSKNGQPDQVYRRNGGYLHPTAAASCTLPGGHPEGWYEAFAQVYGAVFDDIAKAICGQPYDPENTLYPNVFDGVEGMQFIEACVSSSRSGEWYSLEYPAARR